MLKSTVLLAVLVFFVASAFAAPFSPIVLMLSAPNLIQYDFGSKSLAIPVTVTGTPAEVSFCVFTRNQGSKISMVTNGFLGWHHVNMIDTCMYVSPSNQMEIGANTITWEGKDESGAEVPPGEYAYYLFGFDNKSAKVLVTNYITNFAWNRYTILERDEEGKPLARPMLYAMQVSANGLTGPVRKWIVGNDPADQSLLETTLPKSGEDTAGYLAILPSDKSTFFIDGLKQTGIKATKKWTWIPNGNAVLDSTWGTNGEYTYTVASDWNFGPGVVSDGKDWLFLSNPDLSGVGKESELIVINASDGSEVKRLDISKWWVNLKEGEADVGGQYSGGPLDIDSRNGRIALGAHGTCLNSVMDPYAETTDDAVLWVNRNGDYIGDHNWDPSSLKPWVCNDWATNPYKYNTAMDDQGFVIFTAYGGNVAGNSFGLYAPDGTGVAYKNYANEPKFGSQSKNYFVDYGSPFDGIYTATVNSVGTRFVAHDSFSGVISNQTVVTDAVHAAFSVAQNVPNPFNPSTTISYTLAKAGKVTVDVFNVAGQKVDTIANATMSAGSHSVTWNASKFSAGVYFYTVKTDGFSKTMKMTLLK